MKKTRFKIQCPHCDFLAPVILETHAGVAEHEFAAEDSRVDHATGFGHYIYRCPNCRQPFILEDNQEYVIEDKALKAKILQSIEYAKNWPSKDLVVIVNIYELARENDCKK